MRPPALPSLPSIAPDPFSMQSYQHTPRNPIGPLPACYSATHAVTSTRKTSLVEQNSSALHWQCVHTHTHTCIPAENTKANTHTYSSVFISTWEYPGLNKFLMNEPIRCCFLISPRSLIFQQPLWAQLSLYCEWEEIRLTEMFLHSSKDTERERDKWRKKNSF